MVESTNLPYTIQMSVRIRDFKSWKPVKSLLLREVEASILIRQSQRDQLSTIKRHNQIKMFCSTKFIFVRRQQITLKLGNFTSYKTLFVAVSKEFRQLVHVKSSKTRGRVYYCARLRKASWFVRVGEINYCRSREKISYSTKFNNLWHWWQTHDNYLNHTGIFRGNEATDSNRG